MAEQIIATPTPTASGPVNPVTQTNKIYITAPIMVVVKKFEGKLTVNKDSNGNITEAYFEIPNADPSISAPFAMNKSKNIPTMIEKIEYIATERKLRLYVNKDMANDTDVFEFVFAKLVAKTLEYIVDVKCDYATLEFTNPQEPPYMAMNILTVNENAPENFDIVITYNTGRKEIIKVNKYALYDEPAPPAPSTAVKTIE